MADIKAKIASLIPEATFEDGRQTLTADIPDQNWHDAAKALRDDPELAFDFLVTIVGMDWEADGMGCVYYLSSTRHHHSVAVRVMAQGDRKQPWVHSVADLYDIATTFEREVYDFFGIIFIGNPDMRRLFLNIDWKGWPLRKDYDQTQNPVTLESERQTDFTDVWALGDNGKPKKTQRRIFAEDDFVVNIGPQHPATHGVLRFRTAVDGEMIKKIDIYLGYIHRGIEKLCEHKTPQQTLHFMDRMDYFSAMLYHHCLCMTYEDALGVEVPRRAQVIRVLMDELSRIASHCLFIGTYCMDLGATTMLFYTLRVREQILDILERTAGARMTFNYDVIGGVMQDLDAGFVKDVHALLEVLPKNIAEYNKIFTGNVIAKNRMEGVGVLTRDQCVSWSCSGPVGRASGWACDVRKTDPYSIYPELDFEQVVMDGCDSMARFKVRIEEMKQSAKIIAQLVDAIPEGDICAKVPKVIKVPRGQWFKKVEGCRGTFAVFLESDGGASPYRLKLAPPCLPLAAVMDTACKGLKIADLITVGGAMDYIVPDIDR